MSERAEEILDMSTAMRGTKESFESKIKKLTEQGM